MALPLLYRSNHVEELGEAFLRMVRERPLGNPFQAETVLVGSTGLRDWLRVRVAQELGIAAQLSFVYPGALAGWLHQAHLRRGAGGDAAGAVQGDLDEASPWVPDRLVWGVAAELLRWRDAAPCAAEDRLGAYLAQVRTQGDGAGVVSPTLFALASEIRRLFLRYHAWRPEMIAAWARGSDAVVGADGWGGRGGGDATELRWQPVLWRRVRERLAHGGAADPLEELGWLPRHAMPLPLTADALPIDDAGTDALRSILPPRLSLFGVGSLSPLQILALARIAQATEVHWFLTAPTPFWLGDQTARAVAEDEALRRRAHLQVDGLAERRATYLDATRAMDAPPEGDAAPADDGADGFEEMAGLVCPLVASFGRVPRASQLLLEQMMPSAPEALPGFVHPMVAAGERAAQWHDGTLRAPGKDDALAGGQPTPEDAAAPSLLHRLQADVYMLESAAYAADGVAGTPYRQDLDDGDAVVSRRGAREIRPDDHSFGFHACYGPARQVDAVRDLIVEALARDPSLAPRDIAVMTPDIAKFAPLIEATFLPHAPRSESRARTGIPGLPIRIQDRAIRSTNPVAGVLLALLALAEGRRTVTDVIALLGLEPVHTHFGLAREEIPRMESWLRSAGARWGVDAEDVQGAPGAGGAGGAGTVEATAPAAPPPHADTRLRHTLVAALERIALGAVMSLDATTDAEGHTHLAGVARERALPTFPLDQAGERSLAARAVLFLETLLFALEELRHARPLAAWLELFAREEVAQPGLLQRFVTLPASRAWQKAQVVDELEALARDLPVLGLIDTPEGDANAPLRVSPAAMAAWMRSRMDRADKRVSDGIDAVTFCSLMPVRSVPYRWVILLGVDADIFPRVGTRPAWDLMARAPRPWDRNPRDEDRALFLDAMLSAREACHIVFTGRTPQRNEVVAPAAPIAQLMDMLDQRFGAPAATSASRWLTRHYPLQPFSERSFRASRDERTGRVAPRPRVAHAGERRAAESLLVGRAQREGWALEIPWDAPPQRPPALRAGQPIHLTLAELRAFHEDPLAAWLQAAAGLRWPRRDDAPPGDLLPTAPSVLEKLEVMKAVKRLHLPWTPTLTSAFPALPIGGYGALEGAALAEAVEALNALLDEHFHPPVRRRVDVGFRWDDGLEHPAPVEVRLRGDIDLATRKHGQGCVVLTSCNAKPRAKHALAAWLDLLAVLAMDDASNAAFSPDALVIGVAPHKAGDAADLKILRLDAVGAPVGGVARKAWARRALEERLRTWWTAQTRPLPVLPNTGRKVAEEGYKEFVKVGGETGGALAAWMEAFVTFEPATGAGGLAEPTVWRESLKQLRAALAAGISDGAASAALFTMRSEAQRSWALEGFVDPALRYAEDTEDPLLRRIFGELGPAQRWPEAFVLESWRVFGPGAALAESLESIGTESSQGGAP